MDQPGQAILCQEYRGRFSQPVGRSVRRRHTRSRKSNNNTGFPVNQASSGPSSGWFPDRLCKSHCIVTKPFSRGNNVESLLWEALEVTLVPGALLGPSNANHIVGPRATAVSLFLVFREIPLSLTIVTRLQKSLMS